MVSRHHDFIARRVGDGAELIRDFDGMYRAVDDPHGQGKSAENLSHAVYQQIIDHVHLRMIRPTRGEEPLRYLDVGCGLGYFTDRIVSLLRSRGSVDAYGVDISETAVAKATKHATQAITFSAGSLAQPQTLRSLGSFDLVTCFETLCYFTEQEISTIVANLTKLVGPEGYLALSYHLPEQMSYGRYIQGLDDVRRLFGQLSPVWEMDFRDDLSTIYDGSPFGRHLFVVLRHDSDG